MWRILGARDTEGLFRHLRRRLDRLPLLTLPGRRVQRFEATLRRLGPMVPPCVWAAALKALLDGWTTKPASPCLFGCQHGHDDLRHYAYCPVVARLYRAQLCLQQGPPASRLDEFLLLDGAPPRTFALRALGLCATFRATNAARHGQASATGAWPQALADGVAFRAPLTEHYANRAR